jgi:hypothetical protein
MTKAKFYIKGKVQDVGYRPYIMKEIIKREGLGGIADNYSQALTFEQLGKGIPILKSMYSSVGEMNENIKGVSDRIDGMSERVDGMSGRIGGMNERIERMDENITGMRVEMRDGFKSLPKEIAKELKDLLFIRR